MTKELWHKIFIALKKQAYYERGWVGVWNIIGAVPGEIKFYFPTAVSTGITSHNRQSILRSSCVPNIILDHFHTYDSMCEGHDHHSNKSQGQEDIRPDLSGAKACDIIY